MRSIKRHIAVGLLIMVTASTIAAQAVADSAFMRRIASEQLTDSADWQRFDYHFHEGLRLASVCNYMQARKAFEACIAIDSTNAAAYFQLSKMNHFLGHQELAQIDLDKAVALSPEHYYYQEVKAAYCESNKDYANAIALYESLSTLYPHKEFYLYRLVELYRQQQQPKQLLSTLDKIEILHGVTEEVSYARIAIYAEQGKHKKVIAEIQKLINKFPVETRYRVLLGDYYCSSSLNDTATAVKIYNKVLSDFPNDGYAYMSLYAYWMNRNDIEHAYPMLHRALEDKSIAYNQKEAHVRKFLTALVQQNKKNEADAFVMQLLNIYGDEVAVRQLCANYYTVSHRNDMAIEQMQVATELQPEDESNWTALLEQQVKAGNTKAVDSMARIAGELFPENTIWAYYRVICAMQQQHNDTAILLIDRYVKQFSDKEARFKSELLCLKGNMMAEKREMQIAFDCYEKALVFFADNDAALNNYAYFLALCDTNLLQAQTMSDKAVKLQPKNSTYLDTYAWIFFVQGDYRSARFFMERALGYDNPDPTLLEHYGDILIMLGETEEAVQQWIKARDAGSQSTMLNRKIAEKHYIKEPFEINKELFIEK